MKEYNYACPHCHGSLKKEGHIRLKTERNDGSEGMIFLNPKIGSYEYYHSPPVEFSDGEIVTFYCPMCHTDLTSEHHYEYVQISLVVNELIAFEVLFSRKAGICTTYIITEDDIGEFDDGSNKIKSIDSL